MKENLIINKEQEHYSSLDGFRSLSCIGIMMMHIQANTHYQLNGVLWEKVIPSFTHLVLLFLMISGFGMCVGYLKKFQEGTINLESFYKRRYLKILPYYSFLIIIALIYEPSVTNFYEATTELLLLHGLLPNNALNVIGVSWTLGVIFLFYFLFPVYSILMKTKRRSLVFLLISLWINFICPSHYFSSYFVNDLFTARHSFLWCLPLFIMGGCLYLYRNEISIICKKLRYVILFICITVTLLYYISPESIGNFDIVFYKNFILYSVWMIYAIGINSKILGNKLMKFLSGISLEIYLSHMFVFRFMEKIHLQYLFGEDSWISYIVLCLLTLTGLMALIFGYKLAVRILNKYVICKILKQKEVTNEQ